VDRRKEGTRYVNSLDFQPLTTFDVGTGRKKPIFALELWNVYHRVCHDLPRSNNSIEGWHNSFSKRVTINHPTVRKLAEKIRAEQSLFEVELSEIRSGQEPKPRKAMHVKLDDRIRRSVKDYYTLGCTAFLDVIVSLLKM
jgi:hypothetical protein